MTLLAVETITKIEGPHIREAISEIAAKAEGHISKIHQLFRVIRRMANCGITSSEEGVKKVPEKLGHDGKCL